MAEDRGLRRALESVVKLVLNSRLLALLLTLVWLPISDPARVRLVTALLVVVLATSALPLLRWDQLGGWILEHPSWLLVDLLAAAAVLGLAGLESPFVLWLLATALVAGVLYGVTGAVTMSLAIISVYVAGAMLGDTAPTLAEILGTPVLVPVAAFGGAAIRELVLRQHAAGRALAESAMAEAAGSERTRLAREMHDTLAKTLHGIGMSAAAIAELTTRDPESAAAIAAALADTAQQAAVEARALIVDLRTDDLDRPLAETLRESAVGWGARNDVEVAVETDPCCGLSPSVRYELFCIAREALRNAHEHGHARNVAVTLRDGDLVELTIRDDGDGFAVPDDLADLSDGGHFGVIGMRERAQSVGGTLSLSSAPERGTTIAVRVPRDAPPAGDVPATPAAKVMGLVAPNHAVPLIAADLEARP
ncbi:MAG: hypothetical protein KG028_00130 [Actinobacteria bacterium]|nr:hypothetical protein [Actinomycetota bacterium]